MNLLLKGYRQLMKTQRMITFIMIVHCLIGSFIIVSCANCTVTTLPGCLTVDSNNTLNLGNTSNCGCLACNTTYGINSSNLCAACDTFVPNCSTCVNTTSTATCTACLSTYRLNNSTNQCNFCNLTCTAAALTGCTSLDSTNSLGICNLTNCLCLTCSSTYGLISNNTCKICSLIIAYCSTCTNTSNMIRCVTCVATHVLDSGLNTCLYCNKTCTVSSMPGCLVPDVGNTLGLCNKTICGCLTCEAVYGFDTDHYCMLCNSTLSNCTYCTNLSTSAPACLVCNYSFYLNTTTKSCSLCSTRFFACRDCLQNSTSCITCHTGYYLLPNLTCTVCPLASLHPLCWGCYNATLCQYCIPGYGISAPNVCVPCNLTLYNCQRCYDPNRCYRCINQWNIVGTNQLKCVFCHQAMPNCYNCTSYLKCVQCEMYFGTNDTTVPTICVNCRTAMQNCLTCTNYTYCKSCINNTFLLIVNDTLNKTQICPPCSDFMLGCYTCSNQTNCLSCFDNSLYLYNASNLSCAYCNYSILSCSKCTFDGKCTSCQNSQYTINSNYVCQLCGNFMASCFYCFSSTKCTLCIQGKLLPDQSGCTSVYGCTSINSLQPVKSNCLTCDTMQFLLTPQNGQCVCQIGRLVGSYCTDVVGCSGTKWVNGSAKCISCDVTNLFVLSGKTCICAIHYHLDGDNCVSTCGDGYVIKQDCDDGNLIDGDGCSSQCKVQKSYVCINENLRFPSSRCVFRARIILSLQSIQKTALPGTQKITFDISPYSNKLQSMNFSSLASINSPGATITNASIVDQKLVVFVYYSTGVDNGLAQFKLGFDNQFVKSPSFKMKFYIVQTEQMNNAGNLNSNSSNLLIDMLSYFSLAVFVLGSISYKMIGVQTLYTIQIARLLQVTSKYHNSFFAQFKGLNFCYGQISSFFGDSAFSKTIFRRLGFKLSLNDNTIILAVINGLGVLSYGTALIYKSKLKSQIQIIEQKMADQNIENHNKNINKKVEKIEHILKNIYNWLLFPIFIGFLAHSLHTAFVHQTNALQSVQMLDFLNVFVTFIATIIIFFSQIFKLDFSTQKDIIKNPAQSNYISYFLINNFLIYLTITLIMVNNSYLLYYLILGLVLVHLFYLILRRPYQAAFHNFSIIFNQSFMLFNLFWILIKNTSVDTPDLSLMLIYLFVSLAYLTNAFGMIRSIMILKNRTSLSSADTQEKGKGKKKMVQKMQQLTFDGMKISIQEGHMFTDKLIHPKCHFKQSNYLQVPKSSNKNNQKLEFFRPKDKNRTVSQLTIKDLFNK